jgi:hypothetical protein
VDRRTRNFFAVAFIGFVALVGAVAIVLSGTGSPDPDGPRDATSAVGVIVRVESTGLDAVTGITLRTSDGTELEFTIGQLENRAEFPPGHLAEHQATAEPVRVWYRMEGGERVVVRIEDATV